MKRLIPREKNIFLPLLPLCFTLIGYYFLLEQAIMLGDDYFYGLFFREGIGEFFSKMKDHYLTFNGRSFVHTVLAAVLYFDTTIFPLVGTIIALGICYFSYLLRYSKVDMGNFPLFTTVFLVFILCLDIQILKESILWISAYFNYVFPVSCSILLLYFLKQRKSLLFILPTALLLGASTEQLSISSLVALIFLWIYHRFYLKEPLPRIKSAIFAVFFGFVTVMISPGTVYRMGSQTQGNLLDFTKYLDTMRELSALLIDPQGGLFPIFGFFTFFSLYLFQVQKQKKIAAIFFLYSLALFVFVQVIRGLILHLILISLGFALVCLYFCYKKETYLVALLGTGYGSLICVIPTIFAEPRTTLPFFLFLALVFGFLMVEILNSLETTPVSPLFSLIKGDLLVYFSLLVVFVSCAVPDMLALQQNYNIEKSNLSQAKNWQEGEVIVYEMDYDMDYIHDLFLYNGFHFQCFGTYYHLSSPLPFRVVSNQHPGVMVDDILLDFPSFTDTNQVLYLPIDLILYKSGGYYAWGPEYTVLGFGDYRYIQYGTSFYLDTRENLDEILLDDLELFPMPHANVTNSKFYLSLLSKDAIESLFPFHFILEDGFFHFQRD